MASLDPEAAPSVKLAARGADPELVVASRTPSRSRLSDRFELKSQAGAGGMGTVYQAIDRRTGRVAAVKIINVRSVTDVSRFDQEAALLQELEHPGIVRYVDHGLTSHGDPYIAMEWLEGETLEQRLARGRLAPAGVAHLAAGVLEALAAAHAHGIVHRDIKPSNMFLVGWRLFDTRIIDFGVARRVIDPKRYTRRGSTVGTPSYTSPEQARGDASTDGRADIFSLGCVLFECLTGRPPFSGPNPKDVLTAICLTPVPSLAERRPDLDSELAALIDSMLIQDRRRRPSAARTLASAFRSLAARLGANEERTPTPDDPVRAPQALSLSEQRALCGLLVALPPAPETLLPPQPVSPASRRITPLAPGGRADDERDPRVARLRRRALRADLSVDPLGAGVFVLAPVGDSPIMDQAGTVARLALELRTELPGARFCAAVARATLVAGAPLGDLTDRLVALIPELPGSVRLDDTLGRLLPSRLVSHGDGGQAWLRAEDSPEGTVAAVDERQPPLLGRARELDLLLAAFTECASSESARAMLMVAGPGVGKSRLGRALVSEARARAPRAAVYFLRARREQIAVPYGLVSNLLGAQAGLGPEATAPAHQAAFVEWLSRIAAGGPVLLVCDDLQWADGPSLKLIDVALRELQQRAVLVVGLARPEIDEHAPSLWQSRRLERLRLTPLSQAVGQELLRFYRPKGVPGLDDYVFDRWEGNPFFLSELAVAYRQKTLLAPDTVLGTIEVRLARLDEEPRRVLRAASLFGDAFEFEAVLSLLGLKGRSALETALEALVQADLVRRAGEGSGFYAFRSRLLREAAFGLLTPADRALGTARARQWLEEAGKTLPELLLVAPGARGRPTDNGSSGASPAAGP